MSAKTTATVATCAVGKAGVKTTEYAARGPIKATRWTFRGLQLWYLFNASICTWTADKCAVVVEKADNLDNRVKEISAGKIARLDEIANSARVEDDLKEAEDFANTVTGSNLSS